MGLFDEQISRKPNKYPWTKDFIEAIWHGFWTPDEFSFTADKGQFKSELTQQERDMMARNLSAIGQIEIAVKTFWANLGHNLPHPSLSDLGFAMSNSEVIHNLAYEKLLDVLNMEHVFEENLKHPVIGDRVRYLRKYSNRVFEDDRQQYVYAIILFTLFVENASLFSQFYTVMHFNRYRALLKDTAQQVQYTRNEENLHAMVGIKIIQTLREEYPDLFDEALTQRIEQEIVEAIECEGQVIEWIMQGYEAPGLSEDILKAFVKRRIIDATSQIGFKAPALTDEETALLEHTEWFDEELLGGTMTDFFQKRPVEYARNNRAFDAADLF
jgi:ribonucleoside-diphosphate reductase beta chain